MATRADYVAALRRERAFHEQAEHAEQLADVDLELSRFEDEPDVRTIETVVAGPISRTRPKPTPR